MKTTNYKFDRKEVSYNVTADGYDIFWGGDVWISQHGEYGKPIDKAKSYEENCLAQIEELCTQTGPQEDETQKRLSALETTLDDILTNIIPATMAGTTEESEVK